MQIPTIRVSGRTVVSASVTRCGSASGPVISANSSADGITTVSAVASAEESCPMVIEKSAEVRTGLPSSEQVTTS